MPPQSLLSVQVPRLIGAEQQVAAAKRGGTQMHRSISATAIGVIAIALAGCAASATPAQTVTVSTTVTATATITAEPSPSPSETAAPDPYVGLFKKGYPKVVDASEVPDYMQSEVNDGKAVAIAAGVWTAWIEDMDPKELAINGSPWGLCAAVDAWQDKLTAAGFDPGGSTCW